MLEACFHQGAGLHRFMPQARLRVLGVAAPERAISSDGWAGYPASWRWLVQFMVRNQIRHTIFLSGDYHSFWQAELTTDFDDGAAPVVANDFAAGAISSAGGAFTENALYGGAPATSPGFNFVDTVHNGYGLVEATHSQLQVTYLAHDAKFKAATPQPMVRFTLTPGDPHPTQELL